MGKPMSSCNTPNLTPGLDACRHDGRGVTQEPQLPIGGTRPPARKDRAIFFDTARDSLLATPILLRLLFKLQELVYDFLGRGLRVAGLACRSDRFYLPARCGAGSLPVGAADDRPWMH
eukprot:1196324-Prorocentrum_minimum.AAC.4